MVKYTTHAHMFLNVHKFSKIKSVLKKVSINYQNCFICWRLCYFIFSKDFEKFQDETSLITQTHTLYHINNLHKIF